MEEVITINFFEMSACRKLLVATWLQVSVLHRKAPRCLACKYLILLDLLVDLIGIEPMTSSMPWCLQNAKLLTEKQLEAVKIGKTGPIGGL
jgi:hypothetical protein